MEEGKGFPGRKEATGSFRILGLWAPAPWEIAETRALQPQAPRPTAQHHPGARVRELLRQSAQVSGDHSAAGRRVWSREEGRSRAGLVWETASSTARGRGLRAATTALGGAALQPLAAF